MLSSTLVRNILALLLVSFYSTYSWSQVVINEFCTTNIRSFLDDFDKGEDWIELFNNGNIPIDLSGWFLSDKVSNPKKWEFPKGTIIAPDSFIVIIASGRSNTNGERLHANFRITQTSNNEYIVLADKTGKIIESVKVIPLQLNHSFGKPIGSSEWTIFTNPSPEGPNPTTGYKGYTASPKLSQTAGNYADKFDVAIDNIPNAVIKYTLNGHQVKVEDPDYVTPINLEDGVTVVTAQAFSIDTNYLPSFLTYATYFIKEQASTLPTISIASDLAVSLAEGDRELKPITSFEYFDKDGKLMASSYGELDSHGQDSWINPQRSLDWISRDEMGYNSGISYKLFNYTDRDDYQRIILRASGDDNYPSVGDKDHEGSCHIRDEYVHTLVQKGNMKMDVRAVERVQIYINGQYWGIYSIREKPDDTDYTDYTYNQDKYNVQFLKTWGQSWAEYGGNKSFEDWFKIRDFILNNDMSDTSKYRMVTDQYNVLSLIDYMIANLSVVSSDWLNYNTGWWRGLKATGGHKKWGYVMWDNDATFDYYINYSGVPNTNPDAKACDLVGISDYMDTFFPQDTSILYFPADSFFINGEWFYFEADSFEVYPDPGKHEKIFFKLLEESPSFKNLYYTRYADMISTTFSCENMLHTLDSLVAIVQPEMPRQINRWGGSISQWEENLSMMRKFIEERCTLIGKGMVDCYNELSGPYTVTLLTDPPGEGQIKLNSINLKSLPWSGEYFGGIENTISVKSNTNAKFIRWDTKTGKSIFGSTSLDKTSVQITASDTLVAVFENGITNTPDIEISSFQISPNPASNYINLLTEDHSQYHHYRIIDLYGRVVKTGPHVSKNQIVIEELTPGTYTIYLHGDDSAAQGKFVIMR